MRKRFLIFLVATSQPVEIHQGAVQFARRSNIVQFFTKFGLMKHSFLPFVLLGIGVFGSASVNAHSGSESSAIGTATGQHGLLCQMLAADLITPEAANEAVFFIIKSNQQSAESLTAEQFRLLKKAFNYGWDFVGSSVKQLHPACPLGPKPML